LTGVPSAQRTVAFEKACVLFNLGALHTQIGTRQERGTGDGLDGSVDNFLRAAAVFRFIVDNFTNAPSMDLAPEVLEAFILLMMVDNNYFYVKLSFDGCKFLKKLFCGKKKGSSSGVSF